MLEKYKRGFTVTSKIDRILDEEWLFCEEHSSSEKLVFLGYDANLYPMSNFSERPKETTKQVVDKALTFTKDFKGSVYLDDVMIKEKDNAK